MTESDRPPTDPSRSPRSSRQVRSRVPMDAYAIALVPALIADAGDGVVREILVTPYATVCRLF
jgi:hypothetical protein